MKKYILLICSLTLLLSCGLFATETEEAVVPALEIEQITPEISGEPLDLNVDSMLGRCPCKDKEKNPVETACKCQKGCSCGKNHLIVCECPEEREEVVDLIKGSTEASLV